MRKGEVRLRIWGRGVLACGAMRIPASIPAIARVAALLAAMSAAAACTHAGGKLMVDSPKLLPYQPPDIDEITGIDSSEEAEAPAPGAGSAQNPHK
jgi:hypothetical protein